MNRRAGGGGGVGGAGGWARSLSELLSCRPLAGIGSPKVECTAPDVNRSRGDFGRKLPEYHLVHWPRPTAHTAPYQVRERDPAV